MFYAYDIKQYEDDTYRILCNELPELANTPFSTEEKAYDKSYVTFLKVLEHDYRRQGRVIPIPPKEPTTDRVLDVDMITQCRIQLWNSMQAMDVTASWVSRRAGLSRQEIQRVLDFTTYNVHAYKLEELAHCLGYSMDVIMFEP